MLKEKFKINNKDSNSESDKSLNESSRHFLKGPVLSGIGATSSMDADKNNNRGSEDMTMTQFKDSEINTVFKT